MSPELRLTLLGGFTVTLDNQPISGLTSHKAQALLCYLAVTGRTFSRPALAGLLWPDIPEANARMNLRKELARLNQVLRPYLLINRDSVALDPTANWWLDVKEFEALLDAPPHLPSSIETLTAAVALYQGDFLEGFYVLNGPTLDEWALRQRGRLRERVLHALQTLADAYTQQACRGQAITTLQQLLALEPWREEAHCQLMRLYAQGGQRAVALAQYEICRQVLADELAVEPDTETIALVAAIRAGSWSDKETGRQGDKEIAKTTCHLTNLPTLLTSFVGRTQELTEVAQQVASKRLVTLTGVGGVGKTRLALEVGKCMLTSPVLPNGEFRDGVWFVELAALAVSSGHPDLGATLVAQTIARLFNRPEQAGRTVLEALAEYLADKHLLLVLDNCEHLVAACAEVSERLLLHCWQLHILATSREELWIPGETLYPVLPLTLPSRTNHAPEGVLASAAVQLFVERMSTASPGQKMHAAEIATLTHICRQLGGIPLALELAAPLTRSLSLAEIATQLDDQMALLTNNYRTAIPRHQTMHNALIWSYRLLVPEEQRLLARASVFVGGWTLAAAQAVCVDAVSPHVTPANVATLLNQLVAKSWVLTETWNDQRRYRLLEPVRQFAYNQLVARECDEAEPATAARHCHLRYYMDLAEEIEPYLWVGPQVAQRYAQLEAEHDNLRTAINWALSSGELAYGLRLVGALYEFWFARGYLDEGQAQAERLLAQTETVHTAERARALLTAGGLAANQHNYHIAQPLLAASEAIARELCADGRLTLARTCIELSWTMLALLDFAAAQRYGQEGLALGRVLDDSWVRGQALIVLGAVASDQGDHLTARQHFEDALACSQPLGCTLVYGSALSNLGTLLGSQGDYQAAHAYLRQSVAIFDALGDRLEMAWSLLRLGDIAAAQSNVTENVTKAEQYYDQALTIQRELNDMDHAIATLAAMGRLAQRQGDYARSCALLQESLAMALKMGYRPAIADTLEALASLTAAQGQAERAVRIFGVVDQLLKKDNIFLKPVLQPLHDRQVSTLRDQLGEAAFTSIWADSMSLTLEEVTALILND